MIVKKTERGWAGHFICADRCKFRRNTLLEYKYTKIVVSTVGLYVNSKGEFEDLGGGRYFETCVFHSDMNDKRYYDIDVSRPIWFKSENAIYELDADDKANKMHENIVEEIAQRILDGKL